MEKSPENALLASQDIFSRLLRPCETKTLTHQTVIVEETSDGIPLLHN
jgi:hypothetical protein